MSRPRRVRRYLTVVRPIGDTPFTVAFKTSRDRSAFTRDMRAKHPSVQWANSAGAVLVNPEAFAV